MRVVNEGGLQCWIDTEMGTMSYTGNIDLTRHMRDWQAETLRLVQLIVRRLPASEKFTKVINDLKKGVQNV
jgi:hypothetical protein